MGDPSVYPPILITAAALVVYLTASYFSSGYHHPDEHYQIIQFANFKRGLLPRSELPWEFAAKIRSGFQPLICYIIFSTLGAAGINNPFVMAFSLRLLTALLSIIAIRELLKSADLLLAKNHKYALYIFCHLCWFLPYINVRFSSESWAGIFFIFAYALATRRTVTDNALSFRIGIFLGISVLCRYQCGFLALGLFSWMYFVKKVRLKAVIIGFSALIGILLVGVLIDKWCYGVYTVSIYNYFNANILMDIASKYGTSPWYTIIGYIVFAPGWPLGIILLSAYLFLLITRPQSPIIWATLPFLLIHMVIPHKELRFLFPLANLCPILFFSALSGVTDRRMVGALKYLAWPLIIFNFILMFRVVTRSTRNGETMIAQYLYQHYRDRKVNLLTSFETDPYDPFMNYAHNFYRPGNIIVNRITSIWQPDFSSKLLDGSINLLILPGSETIGIRTKEKLKAMHASALVGQGNIPWQLFSAAYDPLHEGDALKLFVIGESH